MGTICPPPVGIGLTDLPNIWGASGPPDPPGSDITEQRLACLIVVVEAVAFRYQKKKDIPFCGDLPKKEAQVLPTVYYKVSSLGTIHILRQQKD